MSAPGITLQLLGGTQAAEHAADYQALYEQVLTEPPHAGEDTGLFEGRFRVRQRQPGFALAEARHGGYLIGYATGMPLRPSTDWWRHLTTPLPGDVIAEHPGRTFALTGLLVRASWRRQGIGRALHDLLLTGRPEERATLTAAPRAAAAQHALRSWGWRKVARTRGPRPGSPVQDVFLISLSGR